MLKDVVEVRVLPPYRLELRFEDGVRGEVDVATLVPFQGVFSPLADPAYFAQVEVNRELGTISWPSGADIDPAVLYATVIGQPIAGAPGVTSHD